MGVMVNGDGVPASLDGQIINSKYTVPQEDIKLLDLDAYRNDGQIVFDVDGSVSQWLNRGYDKTIWSADSSAVSVGEPVTYDEANQGIWWDGSTSMGLIFRQEDRGTTETWQFLSQSTYVVMTCASTHVGKLHLWGHGPFGTQLRMDHNTYDPARPHSYTGGYGTYPETSGGPINTYKWIWELHGGSGWALNGSTVGGFPSGNNLYRIGSWSSSQHPWWGYIHQIVGYSALHDEGRRNQIREILKSKWHITHF